MKSERAVLEILQGCLAHLRGDIVMEPRHRANLQFEFGNQVWSFELKVAADARREHLTALLASAALQARRHAEPGTKPLAIVYAPHLSEGMIGHLSYYAEQYLEGTAWAALDSSGRFVAPCLGVNFVLSEHSHAPQSASHRRASSPPSPNPFGDLGQWLLKVAWASDVPHELLTAPRDHIRTQFQLATAADVSPPTVNRWVSGLKEQGLLGQGKLQPGPLQQVLRQWQRAVWSRPANEISVVEILGTSQERALARVLKNAPNAMLCRYSACEALGISIVKGALPSLYLAEQGPEHLEKLGLREALPGESPLLSLVEPRYPESIRRGAVKTRKGMCTDIFQCYMDVVEHPTRGKEQAESILERLRQYIQW